MVHIMYTVYVLPHSLLVKACTCREKAGLEAFTVMHANVYTTKRSRYNYSTGRSIPLLPHHIVTTRSDTTLTVSLGHMDQCPLLINVDQALEAIRQKSNQQRLEIIDWLKRPLKYYACESHGIFTVMVHSAPIGK